MRNGFSVFLDAYHREALNMFDNVSLRGVIELAVDEADIADG